jgi:radical SAM protein with 4Fe4S-binding SPASM domain
MISTVIAKPTKGCNADCSFCCAPVDGVPPWTFDDFTRVFDLLQPGLTGQIVWIWHGGEPTLMGRKFFEDCNAYATARHPGIRFAIQTNLLSYKSQAWRSIFADIFEGRISTSFDPGPSLRTIGGSADRYAKLFFRALEDCLEDGFRPMVIGTYTDFTAQYADDIYKMSMARANLGFDIRFNYRYPAGRDRGRGELISPENYGHMLLRIYERWLVDAPVFNITPLDQMLRKVVGLEAGRCPWTNSCGGRFLGIEPDGTAYNCSEFADLQDAEFQYGNVFKASSVSELMESPAAIAAKRRQYRLPVDCQNCRHFSVCEGGSMRDAVLYDRGLGGKFYYCESWMMVFDRIRESVLSGEADRVLARFNMSGAHARQRLTGSPGSRDDKRLNFMPMSQPIQGYPT